MSFVLPTRRGFFAGLASLSAARSVLASIGAARTRIGICGFSCHQHWKAVRAGETGVKFGDALGFRRYGRDLGAEGVQVALPARDETMARAIRTMVDADGGFYEGDLRLPNTDAEVPEFEHEVRLAREAGATVARAVLTGSRRYEYFRSLDAFRAFQTAAEQRLAWVEPILRRHGLKLAIENHKDLTVPELVALIRKISSEWIGVLVDTGNNIALLEDPREVVEALAPYALSVHLKDMAVQPVDDGFLLSEVPLGTGALDLPRIVATLSKANPELVFNLEMATRDPLRIPCLTDAYFVTMPDRREWVEPMLAWVKANPPRQEPPRVSGKSTAQILAEEEANNRESLVWMHDHWGA